MSRCESRVGLVEFCVSSLNLIQVTITYPYGFSSDCIVPGFPVFVSNDGTFVKGYTVAQAGNLLEFINQESGAITILPLERVFLNRKPDAVELITGTFVLVKYSHSNRVRKGEIVLVEHPLYSVKIEGNVKKITASDILAVVRQAEFCSS